MMTMTTGSECLSIESVGQKKPANSSDTHSDVILNPESSTSKTCLKLSKTMLPYAKVISSNGSSGKVFKATSVSNNGSNTNSTLINSTAVTFASVSSKNKNNDKSNNSYSARSSLSNSAASLPLSSLSESSVCHLAVISDASTAVHDPSDSEWKVITPRNRRKHQNSSHHNKSSSHHNYNRHNDRNQSSNSIAAVAAKGISVPKTRTGGTLLNQSSSNNLNSRKSNVSALSQSQKEMLLSYSISNPVDDRAIFSVPHTISMRDDVNLGFENMAKDSATPIPQHAAFLLDLLQRLSEELMFHAAVHPTLLAHLMEIYEREMVVLTEISKGKHENNKPISEEIIHHQQSLPTSNEDSQMKESSFESSKSSQGLSSCPIPLNGISVSDDIDLNDPIYLDKACESSSQPLWSEKVKQGILDNVKHQIPWTKESYQRKQAKAQELRFKLQNEKAEKLRSVSDKIKAVSERQEILRVQAQKTIEEKLEKAGKLRDQHLQDKKEKASKDLQPKLAERAQLVSRETEIKKKSVLKRHEITKVRLQELEEERKRKLEENAAKEEAALERRKALEAERIAKIQSLKIKEQAAEANRYLKKQEELALKEAHKEEKAKRLLALKSELEAEQLEKRREITEKLEKSTRLHGAHIESRKEKAAAVSERSREVKNRIHLTEGTRICRVCDIEVAKGPTWLEHLRDETHLQAVARKESSKAANVAIVEDLVFPVFQSHLKKIKKSLKRFKQKLVSSLTPAFYDISLLQTSSVFYSSPVSDSSFISLCRDYKGNPKLFDETVLDASFVEFTRFFQKRMNKVKAEGKNLVCHPSDLVNIIGLLSIIDENGHLKLSNTQLPNLSKLTSRENRKVVSEALYGCILTFDVISFIRRAFLVIHGPLDPKSPSLLFVKNAMLFLETVSRVSTESNDDRPVWVPKLEKSNALLDVMISTDLVGIITVLDSILLYNGPSRAVNADALSPEVIRISIYALKALCYMARLNLDLFRDTLKESSLQTELFHLSIFWLTYITSSKGQEENVEIDLLFQELVLLLGYVCLQSPENSALLRFGSSPVILQLLSYIPLKYFINPEFIHFLYPTLIVSCYKQDANINILADELHPSFLTKYLKAMIDGDQYTVVSKIPAHIKLENRFPKSEWANALEYFCKI